jgi:hypothetical protein
MSKTTADGMKILDAPYADHYKFGSIEPLAYIKANTLGFREGNVIKYLTRYNHKGTPLEDLEKALFYLEDLIYDLKK